MSQVLELFSKQISFIDSLQSEFYKNLKASIEQFNFVIVDYVVNKQLFREGIDGNDKKLKGYKRTTIRYKIAKGDPVDRTTLRDKGVFHASIVIDTYSDRFEISSDVDYAKYLVKRYGRDILKPSNSRMLEFFNIYFIPQLKRKINGQLTR